MADLFHVIDDAHVILRSKGVFRQVKLYRRGVILFAGWGTGFVRLLPSGGTSHPNVSWEDIDGVSVRTQNLSVVLSGPKLVAAE